MNSSHHGPLLGIILKDHPILTPKILFALFPISQWQFFFSFFLFFKKRTAFTIFVGGGKKKKEMSLRG